MTSDTARARELLETQDLTLALCRGESCTVSHQRGVAPLLALLEGGASWAGACAADKVVGAGAAFLYRLLGVREVWAPVMSRRAVEVLKQGSINPVPEQVAEAIVNRAGDGLCPMELAVAGIDDPQEALEAIRQKLEALQRGSGANRTSSQAKRD